VPITFPPKIQRNWLYLPDGWDAAWRSAKSASGTTPAWLTLIGDSVMMGPASSNYLTKNAFNLLRASLLKSYPLYADFYHTGQSIRAAGTFPGAVPWVVNGSPANTLGHGYTWQGYFTGGGLPNPLMTFISPQAYTAYDIVYGKWYAATNFVYNVDGGANQTNSIAGTDQFQHRVNVGLTGLASAAHAINIVSQAADYAATILGVSAYTGANGLGFANLAMNGARLWALIMNGGQPTYHPDLFQGRIDGSTPVGFGFPTQPALAIIQLGINDCQAFNLGPDLFARGLARLIGALRRGYANCSIVILASSFPDAVSSDVNSGLLNPLTWPLYLAAMAQTAIAYNCAFVDLHAKWGGLGFGSGFQASNDLHPTDAGHADIANVLQGII
jgi:hypothetical protein